LKKKCLIVGLGQIGLWYDFKLDPNHFILTHSRAIDLHEDFEIVGAVDFNENSKISFENRYKKKSFDKLNVALNECQPDLVVISTPTEHHINIFNELIKYSFVETILCEKPLSYNFEEAKYIVEKSKELGISLFVNYMRRCDPGVLKIKNIIDSLSTNLNFKGFVWYTKGIYNNGSHMINLIEFWLGPIKKNCYKSFNRNVGKFDSEYDFVLEFEKGKIFFMSAWEEKFSHYTIEILHSNGRIRYEDGGECIYLNNIENDNVFSDYKKLSNNIIIENEMNKYQLNVLNELSKYFKSKYSTICTGEQALQTLEIINNLNK
jgi:predicted dehydrogenase